eukprot:753838-Hanusia_phi.AAC.8
MPSGFWAASVRSCNLGSQCTAVTGWSHACCTSCPDVFQALMSSSWNTRATLLCAACIAPVAAISRWWAVYVMAWIAVLRPGDQSSFFTSGALL